MTIKKIVGEYLKRYLVHIKIIKKQKKKAKLNKKIRSNKFLFLTKNKLLKKN
jgi:hypothetical protein